MTPLSRREYVAALGAGALTVGARPAEAVEPIAEKPPRLWIDPRLETLSRRPWRKIHQDFRSRHTLRYRTRSFILPILVWYTRIRYRRMARQVARQVADYAPSGFEVVGIVGVNGSPSCGIDQTLDLRQSLRLVGALTPSATRRDVNAIVLKSLIAGSGIFVEELQREFGRLGVSVPQFAFDLPSELQGKPAAPTLHDA